MLDDLIRALKLVPDGEAAEVDDVTDSGGNDNDNSVIITDNTGDENKENINNAADDSAAGSQNPVGTRAHNFVFWAQSRVFFKCSPCW